MNARWRAPAGLHLASARLPDEGELPSFDGATGWLNSQPLTPAGLRGKVVLADFWTYTCINWLRQLPYLRAWAAKYSGHGLVVIGVHTPEFSFEHNADNVRRAVQDMRITYPVATDNDYAVWRAFGNHYWPALYFADAQGRIRHHHFGEGEYGQSEMVIQQLLAEAGSTGAGTDLVSVDARGLEAPADWASLRSPENYTGYERTENFASPGGAVPGKPHVYTVPGAAGAQPVGPIRGLDHGGRGHHARTRRTGRSPAASTPATSTSSWDRQHQEAPCDAASSSTDSHPARPTEPTSTADGNGTLTQQRVYQLIRQPGPITDRTFEITFPDPGAQAYCFTFG